MPGGGGNDAGGLAGAGGDGELSNSLCSTFTDPTSCQARGCNPVLSDSRILRISPQAGSGGTAGSSDCSGTGGSGFYLGCTLGAGGAIDLCYCAEDDPTRCLWAPSEFKNIESSWTLGNCGECEF